MDARGSVAIVFAAAIIPLLLAGGVAVDYIRAQRTEAKMLAALDAATLAVARSEGRPQAERFAEGTKFYKLNFTGAELTTAGAPVFSLGQDRVTGTVSGVMPTSFMRVAAINSMTLNAESQALRPSAGRAEIVLVLDYSGSMNDSNKYQRMATVARDFITTMSTDLDSLASLRFAVVPFSDFVSVDLPMAQWGNGNTGFGCTQDRKRPFLESDQGATGDPDSKWQDPHTYAKGAFTAAACDDFRAKGLDTIPLTNDFTMLKNRIAAMQPFHYTHISLGAEAAFHLLSSEAPYTEAEDYGTQGVHKFVVLLSDGLQTSPGYGPGGALDDPDAPIMPNAEANLQSICTAMKAAPRSVTVFTIGYDLNPAIPEQLRALNNLQSCASAGKFYDADALDSDLRVSFDAIAAAIRRSLIYLTQ
jgi:Flp pilus assembly protein TadG